MTTRQRLFVMMVLEFFIWGAWLPLIFGYLPSLGFTPLQQSLILSAFPVASARFHFQPPTHHHSQLIRIL